MIQKKLNKKKKQTNIQNIKKILKVNSKNKFSKNNDTLRTY